MTDQVRINSDYIRSLFTKHGVFNLEAVLRAEGLEYIVVQGEAPDFRRIYNVGLFIEPDGVRCLQKGMLNNKEQFVIFFAPNRPPAKCCCFC